MPEDEEEHGSDLPTIGSSHRDSICFALPRPYVESLPGTEAFNEILTRLYSPQENTALTELIKLKTRLRDAGPDDFWMSITHGLAKLTGAQATFVSKRVLKDEHNLAVEMPPLGEPGSCLMASSVYLEDEEGNGESMRNWKYQAFQCPCSAMRHDKVFVIPEKFGEHVTSNPNQLPLSMESYIGLPLFAEGKCFAHFGVMWSKKGSANRRLTWGFMEMMLHSVEDMIAQRLLEGEAFPTHPPEPLIQVKQAKVIPHEAITHAQSLKPYARSLSHELRTPMQGIVGMLDVMFAAIQEASEDQTDARLRKVFEQLKNNIEIVQDSSRRAMEAADNVVHAYDMNMGVLDELDNGPFSPREAPDETEARDRGESLNTIESEDTVPVEPRNNKRRRGSVDWNEGSFPKIRITEAISVSTVQSRASFSYNQDVKPSPTSGITYAEPDALVAEIHYPEADLQRAIAPGLRHVNLGDVLQYVVNDSLKVGGRPETTVAHQTDTGEVIEVTSVGPDGTEKVKIVEWSVDPMVPESILVDEKDLSKMISCVVSNALKFTDEGRVGVKAKLNSSFKYVVINVVDTGPGMPGDFLPNLFKPFSQEDGTRTRKRDGLGLGLLVAKGISRRLRGSLSCIRTDTSGPRKGTEFEMRVPIIAANPGVGSGPSSPAPSRSATAQTSLDTISSIEPDSPRWDSPETYGTRPPPPRRSASKQSLSSEYPYTPPTTAPRRYQNHRTRRRQRKPDPTLTSAAATADANAQLTSPQSPPLNFLVAEDNKINRLLLVSMLRKLGHATVYEAHDGVEAVRQMALPRNPGQQIDMVLMDLWMPLMDGYEATERILDMSSKEARWGKPTVLAVTADVTEEAMERAWKVGMKGLMTKPYKLADLEALIQEYCPVSEV
ncbi:MAG: hypothetical protein M1822_003221 [Bathelium mastoideum]|nr:MAG: hypothetical protein M1822_003221 [Bathelium mastoideum]